MLNIGFRCILLLGSRMASKCLRFISNRQNLSIMRTLSKTAVAPKTDRDREEYIGSLPH